MPAGLAGKPAAIPRVALFLLCGGCFSCCLFYGILSIASLSGIIGIPWPDVFHYEPQSNDQVLFVNENSPALSSLNHRLRTTVRLKLQAATGFLTEQKLRYTPYLNQTQCPSNFVAVYASPGRLGNVMFQTASLLGISTTLTRLPVFISPKRRHEIFAGFGIPYYSHDALEGCGKCDCWETFSTAKMTMLKEEAAGKYAAEMCSKSLANHPQGIVLGDWLQSYRYFDHIRGDVQKLFTFTDSVYQRAVSLILYHLTKLEAAANATAPFQLDKVALVGVHVRRGDFAATGDAQRDGLVTAPDVYLLNAVDELRRNYTSAVFLVASDDQQYCRNLFAAYRDVVILKKYSPPVHLTVMTLMEHLVISTGSFGWWGAYLSQAKSVVYFKDWPTPGTRLGNQFPNGDYFLPTWFGRSATAMNLTR